MTHHYPNNIMLAKGHGKIGKKIQGDALPRETRNRKWLIETKFSMCCLILIIEDTTINEMFNVIFHRSTKKVSLQVLCYL